MSEAATLNEIPYGDDVANGGIDVWPTAGLALLDELSGGRGRVALIAAGLTSEADDLVKRFSVDLALEVVHLGLTLAGRPQPPSPVDIESACRGATLITDLDVLMWPEVHVAPLQLLAALGRRRPTLAVWPGDISAGRATYSVPGRPDHFDVALRDALVLRPRPARFPDEVPFTIERILL